MLTVNNYIIQTDKDGYLKNLNDWSAEAATLIDKAEGITLTEDHWQILHLLRQFYQEFELSPAMRPLVKYIVSYLG